MVKSRSSVLHLVIDQTAGAGILRISHVIKLGFRRYLRDIDSDLHLRKHDDRTLGRESIRIEIGSTIRGFSTRLSIFSLISIFCIHLTGFSLDCRILLIAGHFLRLSRLIRCFIRI